MHQFPEYGDLFQYKCGATHPIAGTCEEPRDTAFDLVLADQLPPEQVADKLGRVTVDRRLGFRCVGCRRSDLERRRRVGEGNREGEAQEGGNKRRRKRGLHQARRISSAPKNAKRVMD